MRSVSIVRSRFDLVVQTVNFFNLYRGESKPDLSIRSFILDTVDVNEDRVNRRQLPEAADRMLI